MYGVEVFGTASPDLLHRLVVCIFVCPEQSAVACGLIKNHRCGHQLIHAYTIHRQVLLLAGGLAYTTSYHKCCYLLGELHPTILRHEQMLLTFSRGLHSRSGTGYRYWLASRYEYHLQSADLRALSYSFVHVAMLASVCHFVSTIRA